MWLQAASRGYQRLIIIRAPSNNWNRTEPILRFNSDLAFKNREIFYQSTISSCQVVSYPRSDSERGRAAGRWAYMTVGAAGNCPCITACAFSFAARISW